MSLSSYLARPLRWLRAGYSPGAPRHGYLPLIALMPSPATQTQDPPDSAEQPTLRIAPHPAGGRGRRDRAGAAAETMRRPRLKRPRHKGLAVTEIREPGPDQAAGAGSVLPMSVPRLASASGRAR